jgi:nitrous oxide reductase accessory protein NosL
LIGAAVRRLALLARCLALAAAVAVASAASAAGVKPTPRDKCPVCGMFVAKYPHWIAGVRFADGTYAVFDGPKDLFTFWLQPDRYAVGQERASMKAFVTDYYSVQPVDAREAWYVAGSDVHGPMGRELVPFASEAEAREFLRDHHGKRIVRFEDVNLVFLKAIES